MNKFFCRMHSKLLFFFSLLFTLVLLTTNQPVQANAMTDCQVGFDVTNTGCSELHVYWWQGNGDPDVWYATLQPGESWWVSTFEGYMWTFFDVGANDWLPMYTIEGCSDQNINLNTSCNGGNTGNNGGCVPT